MTSPKLSKLAQREIFKELLEREEALAQRQVASQPSEADRESIRKLLAACFQEQREFFFDSRSEGRMRVARCTRRAGKTTGAAIKILATLLQDPRSVSLFVAKSTTIVRDQIWPELKKWVAEYDLPFDFNETQLRISHRRSTGRAIFRGASDTSQLDKLRGLGVGGTFVLTILDESGTFGPDMENLVVSIIAPGLRDRAGELLLIGTPSYFPEGLFYEASEGLRANWVRRRWTSQQNTPLRKLNPKAVDLAAIREEEGLTEDDPVYIREYLGEYCINTKTQMFEYDPAKNGFHGAPPENLTYYLGVDFGWTDETAVVALGWSHLARKMYAVESWAASEQDADQVAGKLIEFKAKYAPTRIIGDTGGYGKGVAMPIWRNYGIYIEQANKLEKLNHVEFMNSAFRRGDLMVNLQDGLSAELPKVLWAENKKDAHNKAKDNRAHALLYSWYAASVPAGKQKIQQPLSALPGNEGWPEEELREKLGLNDTPNLDWFLQEV